MATNKGIVKSFDVTQASSNAHASAVGGTPDVRRIYNFGDRVADLSPEESPFFVYLSKVSKLPTDDSVFRYLEDRSKIDWTSRDFSIANSMSENNVTAGTAYTFYVDDGSGASIDWLIKGMVFAVETADGSASDGADDSAAQVIVRVETAPSDAGAYTQFTGKVISISNSNAGTAYNDIANNQRCQVIGTAFAEGTGSPDVFSSQIDDNYGYTQIFKTACEMTNTAIATKYRGYANEWERIWSMKLREHKVDIERAMLFSQKARQGNIQYSEGLVGHILVNSTPTTSGNLSYTSGDAYLRSLPSSGLTYDQLLSDLEVLFDPARGGSGDRLVLASLPVITFFNKLGDGAFMDASMGSTGNMPNRYNFEASQGAFGHKVMTIETIHGTLHLVKEPLFRGISSGFMLFADMSKVYYRPLVGNGINRDTFITTNVQSDDEDLRKDMILTEAGLEVCLPESHLMYNIEDL
mgnify:CR=1 FL=1|tara:strand:+ start:3705 stop:5102 length:1398 start_codon:yes stop_codon:yes gene_type:complete